jgi:hypothetical protein
VAWQDNTQNNTKDEPTNVQANRRWWRAKTQAKPRNKSSPPGGKNKVVNSGLRIPNASMATSVPQRKALTARGEWCGGVRQAAKGG